MILFFPTGVLSFSGVQSERKTNKRGGGGFRLDPTLLSPPFRLAKEGEDMKVPEIQYILYRPFICSFQEIAIVRHTSVKCFSLKVI